MTPSDRGTVAILLLAVLLLLATIGMLTFDRLGPPTTSTNQTDADRRAASMPEVTVDAMDTTSNGQATWVILRAVSDQIQQAGGLTATWPGLQGTAPICPEPQHGPACTDTPAKGMPWNQTTPLFTPCPGPGRLTIELRAQGTIFLTDRVFCDDTPGGGGRG